MRGSGGASNSERVKPPEGGGADRQTCQRQGCKAPYAPALKILEISIVSRIFLFDGSIILKSRKKNNKNMSQYIRVLILSTDVRTDPEIKMAIDDLRKEINRIGVNIKYEIILAFALTII